MRYTKKLSAANLFIFTIFLFSPVLATSNNVSQEVRQLQAGLLELNDKIATLASAQQSTLIKVAALETTLNTVHREISNLGIIKNQLVNVSPVSHRTANGHGR